MIFFLTTVLRHWVNAMKKCTFCGNEIEENAQFCLYCMHSLTEKKKIAPTVSPKRSTRLLLIILLCLSLFAVAAAIYFTLPDSPISPNSSGVPSAWINRESSLFEINETNSDIISDTSQAQSHSSRTASATITHVDSTSDDSSKTPQSVSEETPTSSPSTSSDKISSYETKNSSSGKEPSSQNFTPSSDSSAWTTTTVEGGVEITKYTGAESVCTIPCEIDGKKVVGVGRRALYYSEITSVVFTDTLQYIGEQAFAGCRNLTSVTIPKSVTLIGANAFTECSLLSEVYIKSASIEISRTAFSTESQRSVNLSIYAPAGVLDKTTTRLFWDAQYIEQN